MAAASQDQALSVLNFETCCEEVAASLPTFDSQSTRLLTNTPLTST